MKLALNHEIIGYLSKIVSEGQHVRMVFSIIREVEVPAEAVSCDELHSYIGKKIGIFNCNGCYKYRVITDKITKKITDKNVDSETYSRNRHRNTHGNTTRNAGEDNIEMNKDVKKIDHGKNIKPKGRR